MFYEFDEATALCDPSGKVVKFYRSASYEAATGVHDAAFGRSVFSFYNGTTAGSGYSTLDGRFWQRVDFASASVLGSGRSAMMTP